MEEKKRADRLKIENEITITIVSGIKSNPQEEIRYQYYKYSKDISASGAKIQGNLLLPIDTILRIDLILMDLNQKITAFGKVKWNKTLIEGESYESGVEFFNTDSDTLQTLDDYISSKQKFAKLNPVGVPFWIFKRFNSDKPKPE